MQRQIQESYAALELRINERQTFEKEHQIPPYILYKTTIDFLDHKGLSLLSYAVALGDMEKVKVCLKNGANINVESGQPLKTALSFGHLEIAKYLYEQGATCFQLDSTICASDETKQWFLSVLQTSIEQVVPKKPEIPININHPTIPVGNHFLNSTELLYRRCIPILHRMVELGDLDGIKKLEGSFNADELLIVAAKYKRLEIADYLIAQGAKINPVRLFSNSALHAAIGTGAEDVVKLLINNNANIDAQDSNKTTPLILAVSTNNEKLVRLLCDKGAEVSYQDIDGENLFHAIARNGNIEIARYLITHPKYNEVKNCVNIYGETPLDIAVKYKQDEIIKLLSPEKNLDEIKKSAQYGNVPTQINQNKIISNIIYYLTTEYRSPEFLSELGYCNGFSYMHLLFSAMGREDYFFDTLQLLASWDKKPESLTKPFSLEKPQLKYYKNLGELFEQWINDLTVFQSMTALETNQDERSKQHKIIGGNSDYEPVTIFCESGIGLNCERSKEQINEILKYLARMPKGVAINIGGSQHVTSAYISNNHNIVSYDPNMPYRVQTGYDVNHLMNRLMDYKYIPLGYYAEKMHLQTALFYFKKDKNSIAFNHFNVFSDNEFPRDKNDAQLYQQNSPNYFTHLHVAVMTHSLPAIKKLLDDNFCDIAAEDKAGRTALDMASHPDFFQHDIIQLFIGSPHVKDYKNLLFNAIKNNDLYIINQLLEKNKIDLNVIQETTNLLPLKEAINRDNEEILKLFIQHGADATEV